MNSTLDRSLHFLIHFVCLSFCLCILFLPAYCSVLKNRLNGWIYSWILAITQEAILRFLFCFLHFSVLWIFCASNRSQKSTSEGVLFPEDTAPEAPGMLRLLLCLYYHNLSTSLLNRAPPPDEMKMLKVQHRISCPLVDDTELLEDLLGAAGSVHDLTVLFSLVTCVWYVVFVTCAALFLCIAIVSSTEQK